MRKFVTNLNKQLRRLLRLFLTFITRRRGVIQLLSYYNVQQCQCLRTLKFADKSWTKNISPLVIPMYMMKGHR